MTSLMEVLAALVSIPGLLVSTLLIGLAVDEIRGRLERVPFGIIDQAVRRLPAGIRDDRRQEWSAELHVILQSSESFPATRLWRGTRFALGLLHAASVIERDERKKLEGPDTGSDRRMPRALVPFVGAPPAIAGLNEFDIFAIVILLLVAYVPFIVLVIVSIPSLTFWWKAEVRRLRATLQTYQTAADAPTAQADVSTISANYLIEDDLREHALMDMKNLDMELMIRDTSYFLRSSTDVISFSAKGSSVSKGKRLKNTARGLRTRRAGPA